MRIDNIPWNFNEDIVYTFLLNNYRLFLKIQWLTNTTIHFYIIYLHRFIIYTKIKNLDTFKSKLQIKVWYNRLFKKELKNSSFDKFRKAIIKYYYFLKEYWHVEKNYWKDSPIFLVL